MSFFICKPFLLVLALIIFGPKRFPEIGRAIGQTLPEFKKSTSELLDDNPSTSEIKKSVA